MVWDLVTTTNTGETCDECDFSFVVNATPQTGADYIVDDGTCTNIFAPAVFGYGINTSAPGYEGEMILMYGDGTSNDDGTINIERWDGWFIHMSEEERASSIYEDTISYDEASGVFSYTYGARNYEYIYYY